MSTVNCSVTEKERYAIVDVMRRLSYLILSHCINIFMGIANLVHIYDSSASNLVMGRPTASELMSWALKLSPFNYFLERLAEELDVRSEILIDYFLTVLIGHKFDRCEKIFATPLSSLSTFQIFVFFVSVSRLLRVGWPFSWLLYLLGISTGLTSLSAYVPPLSWKCWTNWVSEQHRRKRQSLC